MAHILAVDDDPDLCTLLKTALERDGHAVEIRTSGVTVTESLCRWADCILLDVMMPGEDGFATCRRIRAITQAPILFLTARTDEQSVLTGLGIGADDYLTKPFRVAELRARVAAHLRRQNRTPSHKITRGGVALDLSAAAEPRPRQPHGARRNRVRPGGQNRDGGGATADIHPVGIRNQRVSGPARGADVQQRTDI